MMPQQFQPQLERAVNAISLTKKAVKWFGDKVTDLAGQGNVSAGLEEESALLAQRVARVLYTFFYTIGRPTLKGEYVALSSALPRKSIAAQLAAANPGHGRTEGSWICTEVSIADDMLVVEKGGLSFTVSSQCLVEHHILDIQPGDEVQIVTRTGSLTRSPGYYVAHSNRALHYDEPLARLYINASPAAAVTLLYEICGTLNDADMPFDLKAANELNQYHRCDVMVLYVPREDYAKVLRLVAPILDGLSRGLRSAIPAFCYTVKPGVGSADDPANEDSFGTNRCSMVAQGIVQAALGEFEGPRMDAVEDIFSRAGIDMNRPYLNANMVDVYRESP